MTPIPCRTDFAFYADKYFSKTGNAVEVGAYRGEFAAHNLKQWNGFYLLVDTWAHREGEPDDKNSKESSEWEEIYNAAGENIALYYGRAGMLKTTSIEAADCFKDGYFDWIFIDAGHDYKNISKDLNAWWPKLRRGGLFSGDDYGLSADSENLLPMTAQRWEDKYSGVAKTYDWGTALALEEFCQKNDKSLNITWMNDRYKTPAWYIIK